MLWSMPSKVCQAAANLPPCLAAGLFAAGRTCGPPGALTADSYAAVVAKYLNSTCFYVGPILDSLAANSRAGPTFNITFNYGISLANTSDPYTTSPVLQAYQECRGNLTAQQIPVWLGYNYGPVVSIDSEEAGSGDSTGPRSLGTQSNSAGSGQVAASLQTDSGDGYAEDYGEGLPVYPGGDVKLIRAADVLANSLDAVSVSPLPGRGQINSTGR